MAEQAGGGTGEQVLKSGGRAPGKSGPSIGAAPGWFGSQPAHGRRRGSARGRYPPARSWLTEAGPAFLKVAAGVLARKAGRGRDPRGAHPVRKGAPRRGKESAAAGRGEAPRWAIPPVISGDPEMGPTARRATGAAFRTSACRRSAPSFFSERSRRRQRGTRPLPTGRRSVGYSASFRGRVKRGARNP